MGMGNPIATEAEHKQKKYEIWLLSDRLLLTRPDRSVARSALAYLKVSIH